MINRRTFLSVYGGLITAGISSFSGCASNSNVEGTTNIQDSNRNTTSRGRSTTHTNTSETDTPTPRPDKLRFKLSPNSDIEKFGPIFNYIEDELNTELSHSKANKQADLIHGLRAQTVDIAETTAFVAGTAYNKGDVNIALERGVNGEWMYSSIILVRNQSDIQSLSDLNDDNIKIAFGHRFSLAGSIYPLKMLSEEDVNIGQLPESTGDEIFTAEFGQHRNGRDAKEKLINGDVHAACVSSNVAIEEGLMKLKEKSGIPYDPIITRTDLSKKILKKLKSIFNNEPNFLYFGPNAEPNDNDDLWFDDIRPYNIENTGDIFNANVIGPSVDVGLESEDVSYMKFPDDLINGTDNNTETATPRPNITPIQCPNGNNTITPINTIKNQDDENISNQTTIGPHTEHCLNDN